MYKAKDILGEFERLSKVERDRRLSLLTPIQREFLINNLKRSKRTQFEEALREVKISAIKSVDDIILEEEEMKAADWMITECLDFGPGNRGGKCACNRPLRYQFTVEHQNTGKTIYLGVNHVSIFLNIDVKDINGVIRELDKIDRELDELLEKIEHDYFGYSYYEEMPDKTKVRTEIVKHIESNVPLLDRQIMSLIKLRDQQQEVEKTELRKIKLEEQRENRRKFDELYEAERKISLEKELVRKQLEQQKLREMKEKEAAITKDLQEQIGFGAKLDELAYSLVMNGVHSANAISWILVKNFNFDKRISISTSGRPYIYFDVLIALNKYVKRGLLFRDESSNIEDCTFFINPNKDDYQDTENEKHQPALSLF